MDSFNNHKDFGQLLMDANVLDQAEVDELYDLSYYTQNIDSVFKKLGLK